MTMVFLLFFISATILGNFIKQVWKPPAEFGVFWNKFPEKVIFLIPFYDIIAFCLTLGKTKLGSKMVHFTLVRGTMQFPATVECRLVLS